MLQSNPANPALTLKQLHVSAQAWTHRRRVSALAAGVHALMRGLAEEVHARGTRPEAEDASVGGHLMRVRDAAGQPLPFARLWSEISIVFMAGMETTGA